MNTIITIGRQAGSGGREIGQKIAQHYGIKCYDRELLSRAAKESGLCEEIFEQHDERPTNSFLYNLVMDTYAFGYNAASFVDMPIGQKVFLAQFDAIKKLAAEEPCVIVGRCADYALAEMPNKLSIFVHADIEERVKRISERLNMSSEDARSLIKKTDKQRSSYYNYYASTKWGAATTYDFCLDSTVLGIEGSVKLLCDMIDSFENK